MEILRFLIIIERIIVFIVVGGFVPLVIYVFSAHSLNIPDQTQVAYYKLKNQIQTGFVLGVKNSCNEQDAAAFNFYCFQHCSIDSSCSIVDSTRNCTKGRSQYVKFGKRFCANQTVYNSLESVSPYVLLVQNTTLPPLFGLQNNNNAISETYYVFNGDFSTTFSGQTCKDIVGKFGQNIQLLQKAEISGYLTSLQCLFYTLVPIWAFTIISTLIQMCTKYDCKRLMQISLFNACIISLSIVVIGIIFDVKSRSFQDTIKWLGNNCLLNNTYANPYVEALTMDLSNGLSTGFTIAIGIVGGVEIFMIISLFIVWFIEIWMHKLKKQDSSASSGREMKYIRFDQ